MKPTYTKQGYHKNLKMMSWVRTNSGISEYRIQVSAAINKADDSKVLSSVLELLCLRSCFQTCCTDSSIHACFRFGACLHRNKAFTTLPWQTNKTSEVQASGHPRNIPKVLYKLTIHNWPASSRPLSLQLPVQLYYEYIDYKETLPAKGLVYDWSSGRTESIQFYVVHLGPQRVTMRAALNLKNIQADQFHVPRKACLPSPEVLQPQQVLIGNHCLPPFLLMANISIYINVYDCSSGRTDSIYVYVVRLWNIRADQFHVPREALHPPEVFNLKALLSMKYSVISDNEWKSNPALMMTIISWRKHNELACRYFNFQ